MYKSYVHTAILSHQNFLVRHSILPPNPKRRQFGVCLAFCIDPSSMILTYRSVQSWVPQWWACACLLLYKRAFTVCAFKRLLCFSLYIALLSNLILSILLFTLSLIWGASLHSSFSEYDKIRVEFRFFSLSTTAHVSVRKRIRRACLQYVKSCVVTKGLTNYVQ